ncbi:3-deoxy-8-phosphooctulonate synthase [Bernardetia litoralis DSM 6794]|uniref:3-deoxy-8-phosphooctulonate synthase n=1 Tax=Bernardetia litoralis (strain ATCC 23117 / DSM 6794 / NBRC 15988 / NCIMB 1366 / Fx l1 / Sio-4) TaxID=880071 RepID=I4AJY3_BERLS|nr:3-deoxy-8-phosphooctulonate synthase [Bernardetia litoralis]AFM04268.1 3-deoxy-8-phosphooctulonate synthase [Bernardetia litoralis DSM 6794]
MTLYERLQKETFLIAGPCVIENEELLFEVAEKMVELSKKMGFLYIFKASFDKANRTSMDSYRGPGLEKGLEAIAKIKAKYQIPVTTDIHEAYQAEIAAEVVDILQIPAFLCRQTDLLLKSGETGKIVNIKKAQFLTGRDMIYPAKKVESTGNKQIMLTERGTSFGNHNLVVDFRNIIDMQEMGYPVVMDVTHSVQKPSANNGTTGGNREYIPYFAKAAAAMGVKGFFMETHPNPDNALSDGPNMVKLENMEGVLKETFAHIM